MLRKTTSAKSQPLQAVSLKATSRPLRGTNRRLWIKCRSPARAHRGTGACRTAACWYSPGHASSHKRRPPNLPSAFCGLQCRPRRIDLHRIAPSVRRLLRHGGRRLSGLSQRRPNRSIGRLPLLTQGPTVTDFPKVVDFQGTLPAPESTGRNRNASSPAIRSKGRRPSSRAPTGVSTAASGRPSAERGASSSPKASSATSSKA